MSSLLKLFGGSVSSYKILISHYTESSNFNFNHEIINPQMYPVQFFLDKELICIERIPPSKPTAQLYILEFPFNIFCLFSMWSCVFTCPKGEKNALGFRYSL